MTGTAIRVLLVDDQELVRTGLRGILRAQFGFDIVAPLLFFFFFFFFFFFSGCCSSMTRN